MSLKRRFFTFITMALAVVAFSTFAAAQETTDKPEAPQAKERHREGRGHGFAQNRDGDHGRRGMRGMHGGRGMMRGLHGIDLTENQQMQIKSMMEGHRAGNQQQHEEMRSLMIKKRDGLITESESAQLEKLKNDMRASGDQLRHSILALLTPEQNQKFQQMKAEREQRMQERRERREERRQQRDQKPTDN